MFAWFENATSGASVIELAGISEFAFLTFEPAVTEPVARFISLLLCRRVGHFGLSFTFGLLLRVEVFENDMSSGGIEPPRQVLSLPFFALTNVGVVIHNRIVGEDLTVAEGSDLTFPGSSPHDGRD